MAATTIPRTEFEQRWEKAQRSCKSHSFDGLVICSRGGHALDSYADVFYLSNFYARFGMSPDFPPHSVGRSHAIIVLPVDDEPTLILDNFDWRRDLVTIDDVRFAANVPDTVGRVISERGLSESRLGLVAGQMLYSPYRHLVAATPKVEFEPVDNLIHDIRVIKSPRELEILRETVAVGNQIVDTMLQAALKPGTTEAEAVAAAYKVGVEQGMAPYDAFVASGPNSDCFAYGQLPSWTSRKLEAGDLFHVDHAGAVNGYLYDFARSCVVGGKPTREQLRVLETAIEAVEVGIETIRPGIKGCAVFEAIDDVLKKHEVEVSPTFTQVGKYGHGIGVGWEWPWFIPEEEREIETGMCLAVEVMVRRPDVGSAYFEQNIAVTESGIELLSTCPVRYW